MLRPLIALLTASATLANVCSVSPTTGKQETPASMGTDPTGASPLCETVNTGACREIFGSDTACVEKPKDQTWTAQQYIDVMDALENEFVLGSLIAVCFVVCGFVFVSVQNNIFFSFLLSLYNSEHSSTLITTNIPLY